MTDALDQAAENRRRKLKYRTFADYVRSLIRYDCLVGGDTHCVTKPIADRDLAQQDRIDAEILSWVEEGKKGRGVLLEHMIDRALAKGANRDNILDRLADEI